jgi:aldehyde dehydrogenase (NAD+)
MKSVAILVSAVIKTSELTPSCSAVIRQLINETFRPEYIAYIEGEVPETTILLAQKFDHIINTQRGIIHPAGTWLR